MKYRKKNLLKVIDMKRIITFFTLLMLAFGGKTAMGQDTVGCAAPEDKRILTYSEIENEFKDGKDWGNIYVEAGMFYSMGSHTGNGVFENVSIGYRIPKSFSVIYLEWGFTNKETFSGYPEMHTGMVALGYDILRFKNDSFSIEPRLGVGFATGGFGTPQRSYRLAAEAGLMLKYEINRCYFGFQSKLMGVVIEYGKSGMFEFMSGFVFGIRF